MDEKAYLLNVVRERFEAPELESTAIALWARCRALDAERYGQLRKMVIEDKVTGTGLLQSLSRKPVPVVALQRDHDRYTRALDVVPSTAAGLVVLPGSAPWLKTFESELAAFPDGSFDDQVDPFIDAVAEICGNGGFLNLANL